MDRAPVFEIGPRAFPPAGDSCQASPWRMGGTA